MDRTCKSKSVESPPDNINPNMHEQQEGNVCAVCKNLDLNHFDVDAVNLSKWNGIETAYHRELPRNMYILNILRVKLLRGVENGCASCKIIDQARRAVVPNTIDLYTSYISMYKFHDDEPIRFTLSNEKLTADSIASRITSTDYISGMIYSPPGYIGPIPYPGIGKTRNINQDALSREVLELANSWYSSCRSAHPKCSSHTASVLPQRVIWVGANNNDVRLVYSKKETGEYATLSYYWTEEELPYDNDKLETFKKGIPFDELPKTFQDAIVVARTLSIPYLWIDILCMVPRTATDWSRNSNQMHEIYGNAELTIFADDCSTTTMGLSSPQRAFGGAIEIVTGIFARRALGALDLFGVSHIEDRYDHDLWQRAWSLQERMLSRRILHFTAYELSWECDTNVRCECSHEERKAGQRGIREFIKVSDQGHKRKLPEMIGMPDDLNGHESVRISSQDSGEGELSESGNLAMESNSRNPFRTLSKHKLVHLFRKDSGKGKLQKTSEASDTSKGLNILRRLSRDFSKNAKKDSLPGANDKDHIPVESNEDNSPETNDNDNLPGRNDKDKLPGTSDRDNLPKATSALSVRCGPAESESFRLWAGICATYTQLSASPKHPLNSIAGLAFRFGEKTAKAYVAGLWKEDLPLSLLWVGLGLVKRRRPEFPTWSWASVLGPVAMMKYCGHLFQENKLLTCFTDKWLQVKEISCATQYTIDFPDLDSRSMKVVGWMSKIKLYSDNPALELRNAWGKCVARPPAYGCPRFEDPEADFDVVGFLYDARCFLLFVAMVDAMYFLILRKVKYEDVSDENSRVYYERIGWVKVGIRVDEFEKVMEFLKLEQEEFVLV